MKSLKKIAAGALAAVAALGMAGLGATTASAADNATLTVSTADASFVGKTANAYRMFDATVNGDAVAYTLNGEWEAFFSTAGLSGITDCVGKADAELNTCAYDAVSKLGDTSNPTIDAFAQQASNWAQTKKAGSDPAASNATIIADATLTAAANDQYTASFTGLDYGYYLVAVPGVGNVNAANKYATLVPVTKVDGTTATIKGSLPTVDKKVVVDGNASDTTDAKVGDILTFTLTSTIPDMSAYDTYAFNFKDTLSAGLTFTAGSVKVTVDGAEITDAAQYTVTAPTADNGNKLTVTMNDFKAKQQANAGKSIVVTYTAALNENAVVGGTGNTNSATVEYSNNPLTDGKGESTPDTVRVYTYQFGIDKYTVKDATQPNAHTQLAGAKFTLTAKGGADAIKFVVKTAGSDTDATVYRVAKDGETGATTELVTPASGRIDLTGLAKGEYVLTETEAPAGYNKLTKSLGVNVDGTEPTDGTDAVTTITYNTDSANTAYDQTAANGIIGVENTTGPTLPGTGGMGTALFTVLGVLIVALGAGWYVRSRRRA